MNRSRLNGPKQPRAKWAETLPGTMFPNNPAAHWAQDAIETKPINAPVDTGSSNGTEQPKRQRAYAEGMIGYAGRQVEAH